jgi:transcription antitermination protein NusB
MNPIIALSTNLNASELKQCRRLASQFLYQIDTQKSVILPDSSLPQFFVQLEVKTNLQEYLSSFVSQLFHSLAQIDLQIEPHLRNWKMNRLAKIDLAILRVCTFEMSARPDLPMEILLSDAAEIGKEYGTESSGAFVNATLENIFKSRKA